ncbi:MAG: cupin protein [Actinomycetia bacterium]|nr:cupin protein [Actinomycetes bacterium]
MSGYTKANIKHEVEDHAPKFGLSPGLEFRSGRQALECEQSGASYQRIAPDFRQPFGHAHKQQEEVYVLLSGSARVKLDDDVVELVPFDAVRIAPGVMRCVEAGPEGAELILFGAPRVDSDAEMIQGWWVD